jgi:hypothetical protein
LTPLVIKLTEVAKWECKIKLMVKREVQFFLWPKGKYKFFYGQKGIFSFLYVYGHALANAAFLDGCDLVPDACGATGA